jgi:glycosyltransferase involved in cell wall biosynthesis
VSGPLTIWLPAVRAGSGADVFVQRLAQGLLEAGHRPVVQWFDLRYELMPWRLRHVQPPSGTDLIHAGSWQGFAFRREGLPLVVTEHQYVAHPAFRPYRGLAQALYHRMFVQPCMRRSYRDADALVAVSRHTAAAMEADLARPVTVISNWVDCRRFEPASRPPRDAAQPFRLLFVGNPSRWKGADVLPELAVRLGRAFEIHCLGGLRRGNDAARWPANMKPLPRVAPEHMPSIYHTVDAVLVPTRYEAFGYVALEAMACGLPVLGFASTGTAEVAVHDHTALLAPIDDLEQLAAYAGRLATDPALRRCLGDAGRARAVACFDQPTGVGAYLDLYRQVLSTPRACAHAP